MKPDETSFVLADDGELPPELRREMAMNAVYEVLPDMFLLNEQNPGIIAGVRPEVRSASSAQLFPAKFVRRAFVWILRYAGAIILLTLLDYGISASAANSLQAVIQCIIQLPRVWYSVMLTRFGQILRGEVIVYKHHAKSYGFDQLRFRFMTPASRRIVVTKRIRRLSGEISHPSLGTPVAVLYVNDPLFKLL